ncbi:AarF/ABC1/UbiB kinase family protein [Blastomonas sp.]|uniref:ABC1 kinase family protein n=1 Tax=Blastomonas sp. TaxID=1909299 RepID=UPI00261D667A|nr:AarF/ABC1/UbiB kinase family protein [Blastomonas sp.]MDM7955042.1 AarF/ABC1/UbiB kinase family protein [Blastomonas sp.]
MAGGIAGTMLVDGAKQWAQGKRPSVGDLLLTPANARKIADKLATMRGAAMKLGQLMSMDTGDFFPPELAEIMGRLRADAQHMPQGQLRNVLNQNWGRGWEKRFASFDFKPIAAASIGQVHRARTTDGRDLAIKVQYPGVRQSIDSDVDNVASLIKLTKMLPPELDIDPMLADAKAQLHEEADYGHEAAHLGRFGALLADHPDFIVPALHPDFTTTDILAMDFIESIAIEDTVAMEVETRNRIVRLVVELLLRELFEFRLMQTDPNFANYRFDPVSGRLVLLDFGATRVVSEAVSNSYRTLLRGGLGRDLAQMREAGLALGMLHPDAPENHKVAVLGMFDTAFEPLRLDGPFDFTSNEVTTELRDEGMAFAKERTFWQIPPVDTLFIQRKIGGMFLLGSRLKANTNVNRLIRAAL